MVLRYISRPDRIELYIHSLDQISVQVEQAQTRVRCGRGAIPARRGQRSSGFTAYSKKTFIHKSTNTPRRPSTNIVVGS